MKRSSFNIMSRLIVLVASLLPLMLLAVVLGVLGFFCAIFITVFGGFALLNVLEFSVPIGIGMIFVCVIVFAVLRGILHYGEQACNHYIAFKLLALIRDKVFKALRRLAPAKLDGKDKGNLITILTTDIELLEVFYAHTISPIAIAVIVSVVMSIFVGQYHISQGFLTCIGYVVVGIFIPVYASKKNKKNSEEFRDKFGDMNSFYLDSLRGLKEIIQYGIGGLRLRELDQRTDELSEKEKRLKKNSATNSAVTSMAILLFSMIMLFLSVYLYGQGHVSFDGVLIPTIAMMSSFGPVIALANLGTGLSQTLAAGNRVMDVLDEMPVTLEVTNKTNIMFDGVVCEDVSFSYGDEKVLEDVSIRVPQGQVIGITGKSGSGKSTLLRLLMHFWNTEKGKVMISNTDIREINTDNLRDLESFVTQETQMFSDSIENNLKIAKLDASHNEIIQSCKKASIHDFIMTLPNGYDTKVGELGETLSGGERQRLGVARAFLHDAPLILLDEPTSNLDSLNEAVILKSLVEKRKDKTVILVSHRISTMKIADQSYSVENGRMS